MNYDLDEILAFTLETAAAAGRLAVAAREGSSLEVRYKSERNIVTSADVACEKYIVSRINEQYPGHKILAEESLSQTDLAGDLNASLWVIDPIDGTTNYSRGHNHTAVSMAFLCEGVTQAGVVHAPFQQETFSAARGRGAQLNGSRIQVRGETSLSAALIGLGHPWGGPAATEHYLRQLGGILDKSLDVRRLGAGAVDICWVACGRLDGFWETLKPWDIAAASLIAREAGARIGHLEGLPEKEVLPREIYAHQFMVAAPGIFEELFGLLAGK